MIRCAHCKDRHATIAEVRNCSQGKSAVAVLERTPVTEPGMYRLNGDVFQVAWNQSETHLYAKLYVPTSAALGVPDSSPVRESSDNQGGRFVAVKLTSGSVPETMGSKE